MNEQEFVWTTTMIGFAVLGIVAIFAVSWLIVRSAAKGNRWFRRHRQTPAPRRMADRSDWSGR